jgi:hypothetical protein
MIQVRFENPEVQEIVEKAFIRSFTRAQVSKGEGDIEVCDRPQTRAKKKIVFGAYPTLGDTYVETRWNNLGYGKVVEGESVFGVADPSQLKEGAPFVSIFDSMHESILWVNRRVGLIDGFDWFIIERFITEYRNDDLICLPALSEIPLGYSGAVTFRIDCDEAVLSGRPLFELYKKFAVPFSVAIKTQQNLGGEVPSFLREILAEGGSVLSHSHVHAPDWGEPSQKLGPASQGDAYWEASTSLAELKKVLPDLEVRYAVSPFHQNPPVAVKKILDAGIQGFVGGIICNDPEFLLARGGAVPFVSGMISHSEQCMLHGDVVHDRDRQGADGLDVYRLAFRSALSTQTFFGYLDHPFSAYTYGWNDESERLGVHEAFLAFMKGFSQIWYASTGQTLDWFSDRDQVDLTVGATGRVSARLRGVRRSQQQMKALFKGKEVSLDLS